jgi:hypothetical protein
MSRFSPADDLLHDISDAPHGRESLFWVIPRPAEGLMICIYAWRTAATGRYGRVVCVGGPDADAPIAVDFQDGFELEGDNLDDCSIGGLMIRQPDPLVSAEISYAGHDIVLEARFDALHEPFSWHENPGGCPWWVATERFEQSCRVSGSLQVAGHTQSLDGYGHRDHSWGSRDWRALMQWKWIVAVAGDDLSLHAWESYALAERQVMGYVQRAGKVVPLVDVQLSIELDESLLHESVTARLLDATGGETTLTTRRAAIWKMPAHTLYLNEAAMFATIDGRPAVAHVEFGWPQGYFDAYAGGDPC